MTIGQLYGISLTTLESSESPLSEWIMGIDWIRMRPNPDADASELQRLIDLQAKSFQSLPNYWQTKSSAFSRLPTEASQSIQTEANYRDCSDAIARSVIIPQIDSSTGVAIDDPSLVVSWRVYVVTWNSVFPPEWRLEAYRTYLADALGKKLLKWRKYISDVLAGRFQSYLLELYLYEITVDLWMWYRELQRTAMDSLAATGKWALNPKLATIREQIFSFELPDFLPCPLWASAEVDEFTGKVDLADHVVYQTIASRIQDLIALTRAWDSGVRESWKLRNYENCFMSFEQFVNQASDPWLHDFFAWADACSQNGMGLFLDY